MTVSLLLRDKVVAVELSSQSIIQLISSPSASLTVIVSSTSNSP